MTILIIENERRHCETLCLALTAIDTSIECVTMTDSEKALSMLNEGELSPQLVLIDLMTAKVDGVQFYYSIKANSRLGSIQVWLMSSYIKETDIVFFERANIKLFLKQSPPGELIASVESVLRDHKLRNPLIPSPESENDVIPLKLLPLQLSWK
jgi:DNA-binding response OmpR family regulator